MRRYSITGLESANFTIFETQALSELLHGLNDDFHHATGELKTRIGLVKNRVVGELRNRINKTQGVKNG